MQHLALGVAAAAVGAGAIIALLATLHNAVAAHRKGSLHRHPPAGFESCKGFEGLCDSRAFNVFDRTSC